MPDNNPTVFLNPENLIRMGISVQKCIDILESLPASEITPARVKVLLKYKEYCANCTFLNLCKRNEEVKESQCQEYGAAVV